MKKLLFLLTFAATKVMAQSEDGTGCPTVYADPYADCEKGVTYLNASPGFDSYSWAPAANVSNPNIANPTTTTPGTYTVTASVLIGADLVTNGDFSSGNTGFSSGQTYSSTYSPCNYFVGPGWFSSTYNSAFPDHTATTDNMFMSIDGCSPATVLWQETMSVASATNYTFSFWASEADQVQPTFEIHFIGDVTGDNVVATLTGIAYSPATGWKWDKYEASCWNSDRNSTVTVQVINLQTNSYGNDFGMDDFSFRQCCSSSYTVSALATMGMNLLTNGDFSAGNTGFFSGQTYSSVYTPCDYFVGPSWFSTTYDPINYPDHTPSSDNMFMSIDGCSPATIIWQETFSIAPNTTYNFAFWATEADQVQPKFEIHFIGNASGDVVVNTVSGIPYAGAWTWDEYGVPCWNSLRNTTLTVRIINLETNSYGNDFAMDDFSFRKCCYPDECCNHKFARMGTTGNAAGTSSSSGAFDVFPNPNNGSFELQLDQPAENAQVEIFNVVGERVDEFSFTGTSYLYAPKHALPAGTYMMRVTSNGKQYSQRIVVE